MPRFVSTFRATYDAADEVSADVIADQICLNAASDLDEEEGDTFECTQTTSNALDITPEELMTLLRKARNALIRTRWRPAYELAREFDRIIYALQFRDDPRFTASGYDFGHFMDLAERILNKGEDPDVTT